MKRKLLVLTSTFPRWPTDTDPPFVYELSKRLVRDFDITVHAPHYPGAKTREVMDGMKIHRFRYFVEFFEKLAGGTGILPTLRHNMMFYGLVPFFLVAQFFSLLLVIKKTQPEIIHAHWIFPQGFIASLMKIFFGIPVVVTAHGSDISGLQHYFFMVAKRFTLRESSRVTVVSSELREKIIQEILPVHVDVIPMGVSSNIFSPGNRDEVIKEKYDIQGNVILYVGRLSEKKGVHYLIDAMSLILNEFPDSKLLIVGNGEFEAELQKRVQNFGLQNNIVFVGGLPNEQLPVYYASVDIFVSPSLEEGLGLTFVEAAMSGCLLIGTDVGGIRDIIEDCQTGFLVPEKDSIAIAEKIIYAWNNPDEIKTIVTQARENCISKFDWHVISQQYTNLLIETASKLVTKKTF